MFQRGGNRAELDLELRAAPDGPHRADRVSLLAAGAHARAERPAGSGLAPGGLRPRHRARRHRAQLAGRQARRGQLLLHAHDPARDPRRPRAAVLRRRPDRPDASSTACDLVGRAAARPHASPGRAPHLGRQPLPLAHPVPVRRGTAPRRGARARALRVLHVRLPDVGAGRRDAAGARLVRHRVEARLHRGRPLDRDDPRQRLHVVVERVLHRLSARAPSGGSPRCTTRTSAGS